MDTTSALPALERVRGLVHRGVDTAFDRIESLMGQAPSAQLLRLTVIATDVGRTVVDRVRPDTGRSPRTDGPPARVVPPGPDVVTREPPLSPAAAGAEAARAERERPSPADELAAPADKLATEPVE
jgi:hypothetical protein